MRIVSAAFEAAIAEGCVRFCELYDVALADGNTYRYTDHDKNLVWNAAGDTYTAIPIKRGAIQFNSDGQGDECEINLGNISGDLYNKVLNNILEAAVITIKRIRWDASYAADEEIQLFVGVPDVGFNNAELSLNLKSIFATMNMPVPAHTYQDPCNHALFDINCGLVQADYDYARTATGGSRTTLIDATAGTLYKVDFDGGNSASPIERGDTITGGVGSGTGKVVQMVYLTAAIGTIWYLQQSGVQFVNNEILTGGGNTVTVNGTPAEDIEFYKNGELEITSGANDGARRPIQIRRGSTITVKWPFVAAIITTDTYKIYPGCDGRAAETCLARFNNIVPWDGYPFIPRVEETIF
jgi:hypothetical protein